MSSFSTCRAPLPPLSPNVGSALMVRNARISVPGKHEHALRAEQRSSQLSYKVLRDDQHSMPEAVLDYNHSEMLSVALGDAYIPRLRRQRESWSSVVVSRLAMAILARTCRLVFM